MSSDAERAYWREKKRRNYYANLERERARNREAQRRRYARLRVAGLTANGSIPYERRSTCLDCGTPISQSETQRGRGRLRCVECQSTHRKMLDRGRVRHRTKNIWRTCPCGVSFHVGQHMSGKRYCSKAHWQFYTTKSACLVRYASCQFCRAVLVLQSQQMYCPKPECRKLQNRFYVREYMRRTGYMGAKYWRVANTPEAKEIASLYFNLRKEIFTRGLTRGR